ncbi:MAG: acylphosphatase [bacterium]
MERLHLRIRGRVQGVCYRAYASDKARALGLSGEVRNRSDGSVELIADGGRPTLQALLDWCWQGSPAAQVDAIDAAWSDATGEQVGFHVKATR